MAVDWLQNQIITNNELLGPVLFFRSVGIADFPGVARA